MKTIVKDLVKTGRDASILTPTLLIKERNWKLNIYTTPQTAYASKITLKFKVEACFNDFIITISSCIRFRFDFLVCM